MTFPEEIEKILYTLNQNGFDAYLVGGCIRDKVLGKVCHDYDIATNAKPEQILSLFKSHASPGISYGTVLVNGNIEVTTFRKESQYLDHRHPSCVTFVDTLEEDLKRRDFTINALAYHPKQGIIDIFGGLEDCKNKVIRCIKEANESFCEDALRILRAYRFKAKLGFELDESVKKAIENQKQYLNCISGSRCKEELIEILQTNPFVIEEMVDVLVPWIPECKTCLECEQHSPYHFTNVLHHSLLAISYLSCFDETLAFALLFHDLGKPEAKTTKNGVDHFKGHPKISYEIAKRICISFQMSAKQTKEITQLVYYHDDGFKKGLDSIIWFRIQNQWSDDEMRQLMEVRRCDLLAHSKKGQETLIPFYDFVNLYEDCVKSRIFHVSELAIHGKDILEYTDFRGKEIKEALNACLIYVFKNPDENQKERLLSYLKLWKS